MRSKEKGRDEKYQSVHEGIRVKGKQKERR